MGPRCGASFVECPWLTELPERSQRQVVTALGRISSLRTIVPAPVQDKPWSVAQAYFYQGTKVNNLAGGEGGI